jgi:hypothetical protein
MTFILELMGITWPRIRKVLVDIVGEKSVALLEKGYSVISTLIELGPAGVFKLLEEKLDPQKILDMIIHAAVDYLESAILKSVVVRVAMLFNPVGAIVEAIEAIYRVLKWIFQNAARIFSLIETLANGIADIVAGNISGMANAVEKALVGLIPPVIGFLADYFGLGDLPDIIRKQIEGLQDMVMSALKNVLVWLVKGGKALWGSAKSAAKSAAAGVAGLLGFHKQVKLKDGEVHTLSFAQQGERIVLMIASNPTAFRAFISGIGRPEFMAREKQVAILMVNRIDALEDESRASNVDNTANIEGLVESLGEITANIMNAALRHDVRTTPPVYAGLTNGFARGMRVMLSTSGLAGGTPPGVGSALWDELNLRRNGRGAYYIKGHLLNEKLGGPGTTWQNLTPLSRSGNYQHESRAESIIKPTGGDPPRYFLYVVTPSYGRSVNSALIASISAASNPDSMAAKLVKQRIVTAEASVPANMVCTIREVDEGGNPAGTVDATYTIENIVDQSGPASYEI